MSVTVNVAEQKTLPPQVITFGCRLNSSESETIHRHLVALGRRNVVVINSCAVTAEAERHVRQAIRRVRRKHPGAEIIVTGCAAQINPQAYAALPEVDRVLDNTRKLQARSYVPAEATNPPTTVSRHVADVSPSDASDGLSGRTRALLQVQQGCDHRCTFCIIPFGRGPSHSLVLPDIIARARELVRAGHREIVLTGVDLCSYGRDLAERPTLGSLVRHLLDRVPDLERLRLSSVDPAAIDADMMRVVAEEPRFMPHLHLSLQAGDDLILKRMKRRHRRDQVIDLCRHLRSLRPDMVFGADIIAGFPTETEALFANTLALVDEADLTHLHVFPYSPRPETPAAHMPPVAPPVVKARAAQLRRAGARRLDVYLHTLVGRRLSVLIERPGFGREAGFAPVRVPPDGVPGQTMRLMGHRVAAGPLLVAQTLAPPPGVTKTGVTKPGVTKTGATQSEMVS